jgi:hypothetical protein
MEETFGVTPLDLGSVVLLEQLHRPDLLPAGGVEAGQVPHTDGDVNQALVNRGNAARSRMADVRFRAIVGPPLGLAVKGVGLENSLFTHQSGDVE